MQLEITAIRTDGGTQPRATYHYGQVDSYAEDMEAGVVFPSIVVFFDGSDYWLADGFHRVLAATKIEQATIESEIRQGTLQDAQWYSYSVNQAHGLRRSNEDKRRAVEAALRHPNAATMSDHQIADHCGVTHPFVGKLREEQVATSNSFQSTARKGRDGRTINTSNIGKKKNPPASKVEPEEEEPLTPYEQQIADRHVITEPAYVSDESLNEEVDRLVAQYRYDDLCRLIEMLSERVVAV